MTEQPPRPLKDSMPPPARAWEAAAPYVEPNKGIGRKVEPAPKGAHPGWAHTLFSSYAEHDVDDPVSRRALAGWVLFFGVLIAAAAIGAATFHW